MHIVNTANTRSLNIDGQEFLADQPIHDPCGKPEHLAQLIADELVIEKPDDPEAIKLSGQIAKKIESDTRVGAAAAGIDLDNPTGKPADSKPESGKGTKGNG